MQCYNFDDLVQACKDYVGIVASRVDGAPRIKMHEKISEITGISYDELKEYLYNLDRYGYTLDLEEMESDDVFKFRVYKIAERLAEELSSKVVRKFLENFPEDLYDEFRKYELGIDDWLYKWRKNGSWICDGEPILDPECNYEPSIECI